MVSIPASAIARVVPNVISAGGSGLDLIGLVLTDSDRMPIGQVMSFSSAEDVSAYFGPLSDEALIGQVYFSGYEGSSIKPGQILFSRYATDDVPAFLRGGSLSALTLTQLQALTGVLTVTVNGVAKTSSTINLAGATSFSNAATLILAAFTSPGFTVAYDSISGGFVFTNSTDGVASTLTYATGTLSAGLKLTQATGAVLSAGADEMTPAAAMDDVVEETQNWVSFMTGFASDANDMDAFAEWADGKQNRFLYVAHDQDINATVNGNTTSFAPRVTAAGWSSVMPIYDPAHAPRIAAFVMGAIASVDFGATNGRVTLAFRIGDVSAGVTNQTLADNLKANGYNFVGAYATANDEFVFLYPGQVSGPFEWADSWVNQVWMNNGFQLGLMTLLTQIPSVPYNADGYALIEAAMMDQVNAALSFGAIRAGVTLSTLQAAQINNAAGLVVSDAVQHRGWYIKVGDASPEVRAARGSPPVFVWYTDGQSVQQLTVSSVLVQ